MAFPPSAYRNHGGVLAVYAAAKVAAARAEDDPDPSARDALVLSPDAEDADENAANDESELRNAAVA